MTQQLLDAGVYTPTLTNTANLDGSTAYECYWTRIGNLVHVAGMVDIDPTAAAPTSTILTLTLPLPTTFSAGTECFGVVGCSTLTEAGIVRSVAGGATVQIVLMAVSTANHTIRFEFTYRMIQ